MLYHYEYVRNDQGQIEDIAYVYPARTFEGDIQYPYSFFGGDPLDSTDKPHNGNALVGVYSDSLCKTH
jgi:hypothetical protein